MHEFNDYLKKGNYAFELKGSKFVFSDHFQNDRRERMAIAGGSLSRQGIKNLLARGTPFNPSRADDNRKIIVGRLPKPVLYNGVWCLYAFAVLEHVNKSLWVIVTCCHTNNLHRSGIGNRCLQRLAFQD